MPDVAVRLLFVWYVPATPRPPVPAVNCCVMTVPAAVPWLTVPPVVSTTMPGVIGIAELAVMVMTPFENDAVQDA